MENTIFFNNNFIPGRLIFGSKSGYRQRNPDNIIYFNANIITKTGGKIWYGDIDLNKDYKILLKISNDLNENLYILSEMDGRFGKESEKIEELIKVYKILIQKDGEIFIKNIFTNEKEKFEY
jgi:hypothetical protein